MDLNHLDQFHRLAFYHINYSRHIMAERVGFEPTVLFTHAGFQDRCNKPSSATSPYILLWWGIKVSNLVLLGFNQTLFPLG